MISKLIGRVLMRPNVHNWLLAIAMKTPDTPIMSPDGSEVYMHRYWLFNQISDYKRKYRFILFSIRIHNILRHDMDRHMHDHPFNARTWIMRGGYDEIRLRPSTSEWRNMTDVMDEFTRVPGDTSTLGFEQYHQITAVRPGGALTLFMFGGYLGRWGFAVDGLKIPHAEYEKRFKGSERETLKLVAKYQRPVPEDVNDIMRHVRSFTLVETDRPKA